ncbi:RiPP maturation radical SAM C-methyltransferase [Microvirga massiliensis]|uniref:RiPP maturation radical SAM C-methyltransferase n=1 Tax=Microvirga massiliensis TaxID=1033741 RepID=UPI000660068A|nr:RiPP maturation radical SAM C-methyltransferase [Microvirga massiliensis]
MKVLLVNMPFAAVRPAIGPSLLKSHLAAIGYECCVLYLNLRMAQRLGNSDFSYIADRTPTQSLSGDWVFAPGLFGSRPEADREYVAAFNERFGRYVDNAAPLAVLQRARAMAEDFLEECLADDVWKLYDVIGFTSTFTQHVSSLALAQRLKQRYQDKLIVFGGANCEDQMGVAVHRLFPFVDYVCSGEADISFPRLIRALDSGENPSDIPGVIYRRDAQTRWTSLVPQRVRDLDTLPMPDYDDYFEQLEMFGLSGSGILMESSRGCWWGEKHHCTFCGLNGTAMAFRCKSASRVLAELDAQVARYRPAHVEMVDNILDMHYFRDLLPELHRRHLNLGLFYETKANLTKVQVQELFAAGITSIQPGIESFSTSVLKIMRKGTTALQNVQLLKWCKEVGMKVYWNLLYGFPGEDPNEYKIMSALIDKITHLDPPQGMGGIRLDRFSPNFVSAADLGLCNVRPDRSYRYIYDLPESDLYGLAYYFEHDYRDQRDPHQYIHGTEQAMRRWYAESGGRGLVYVDHGDHLAIWDFRTIAEERLTILTGSDRALYLFCDAQRSAPNIMKFAAEELGLSAEAAMEAVTRLAQANLIVEVDARFLSLAVSAPALPDTERSHKLSNALAF